MLKVDVVYVPGDQSPVHLTLQLEAGTTVAQALERSGIYARCPEARTCAVGIYAQVVPLDKLVREGDRIELYRPLTRDPKERRRKRAKSNPHKD
ncbi:MAG: RnfH family protein [Legionella sp.]